MRTHRYCTLSTYKEKSKGGKLCWKNVAIPMCLFWQVSHASTNLALNSTYRES
jgi:hypothetical protein